MGPVAPGFEALEGEGDIHPSDTVGAAGPDRVVTAVNSHFAVYEKDGTNTVPRTSLADLVNIPTGAFVFDPKVVYDHYHQRFLLVFLGAQGEGFPGGGLNRSWILVVAMPEATADDPSTYCARKLNGDQVPRRGKYWADYPGLGFDRRHVYVTSNQFTFGDDRFGYAQILGLRKGRLYNCERNVHLRVFSHGATRDPEGTRAFTIQPAVTQSPTGDDPNQYLVSFQDTLACGPVPCGRRVTLWMIRFIRGDLRLDKRSVRTGLVSLAPLGTQRDGSPFCTPIAHCWDTGDLRLINAFYDTDLNRLYTGHAIAFDFDDGPAPQYIESAVRWYELVPRPWRNADFDRRGTLGETYRDAGWPTLATDGNGGLWATYSQAGTGSGGPGPDLGEYLSAYGAFVDLGMNDFQSILLSEGEARYQHRNNLFQRWGDYTGISRDPDDPLTVWMVNQYAEDDGSPPTNIWQQVVHPLID
jgi:hypothetical protein